VVKIIPMEGLTEVNGAPQKGAGELMAEAVIALALSGLRAREDADGAWRWLNHQRACAAGGRGAGGRGRAGSAAPRRGAAMQRARAPAGPRRFALPSSKNPRHAGERLHSVTPAFVRTCRAGVCRGRYSKALIKAWRAWDKAHGSGGPAGRSGRGEGRRRRRGAG
jgi:hypothetical protein